MWSRSSAKALVVPSSRFAAPGVVSASVSYPHATIMGTNPVMASRILPRSANYSAEASGDSSYSNLTLTIAAIVGTGVVGYSAVAYMMREPDTIIPDKAHFTNPSGAPSSLDPEAFVNFPLIAKEDVSHDSKIFRFGLPSANHILGLPTASCVVVKGPGSKPEEPVIRPYTPTTKEEQRGYFDLLVKEYENGNMSKHIHSLKVGDNLEVKGPISKIPYTPNMKKDIAMIAGGTGITPMYQVLQKILNNPNDNTRVQLIFCNKSENDILLKDKLDHLSKQYPQFKVHYVIDRALEPAKWNGDVGYITKDIIKANIAPPTNDTLVFVCGPPGFYSVVSGTKTPDYKQGELKGFLKELGYKEENVFKF